MRPEKKLRIQQLRRWRIRKKVIGTKQRPRMSVRFTGKNIHVQFIDDEAGVTLACISTLSKSIPDADHLKANIPTATQIGSLAAETAKSKGILQVVFDRSGARFHGKVEALAKAARGAGLQF